MKDSDIYFKTDAGLAEVRDRGQRLPQRVRTMLIMVDGTRSVAQLREAARTLAAPEDFLESLEAQGLIRPDQRTPPRLSPASRAAAAVAAAAAAADAEPDPALIARCRAAVRDLNGILGPAGESIAIKMERARHIDELRPLLHVAAQVIASVRGRAAAEEFLQRHQR